MDNFMKDGTFTSKERKFICMLMKSEKNINSFFLCGLACVVMAIVFFILGMDSNREVDFLSALYFITIGGFLSTAVYRDRKVMTLVRKLMKIANLD